MLYSLLSHNVSASKAMIWQYLNEGGLCPIDSHFIFKKLMFQLIWHSCQVRRADLKVHLSCQETQVKNLMRVPLVFMPLPNSHRIFLCGFTNCQQKKNTSVSKKLVCVCWLQLFSHCEFSPPPNGVPSEEWQSQNQIRPFQDSLQTGARW